MVSSVEAAVIDSGLTATLDTASDRIMICQSEPTTYALATTGHLGLKSWGVGNAFSSPADVGGTARSIASVAITDGTILTTGTASWWAAVGTAALHAHGLLSSPQNVTNGNTFTLGSFYIKVPQTA